MAFYSLFDVVTLEAQIEGNLSKRADKTHLHSPLNPRYDFSVLHKTYQEMLACVYNASMPSNSEEHKRLVKTIKASGQTLSFDIMLFLCCMHGTCAKVMFEIYCDLQTEMLCQISEIEYSSVILFHANSLSIIEQMKANNIACETGIKMRSLLLDRTYNDSCSILTEDCGDISLLAFEQNENKNIDLFDNVQAIAENCKSKLIYIRIENSCDMDYDIPCPIAPAFINTCINLHTLVLSNLTFGGELGLTGCSSLSTLDLSLPVKGDPVRLIISPHRLTYCYINIDNSVYSPFVSIKCTCPFNSQLLEKLVLLNVKLENDLRLLDCGQLQRLGLVNVDTTYITTSIDYSEIEVCHLGSFTDQTVIKDALQSLQHSKCL
ncbi:uncharacterized protein LOC128207479 isoform X1 [Mya arenaria]|uniref:uncharacterized protein LOC128207479 isoform X1 n=1 Tax=Mya arenaria TaxID=6604 RepID=UPI0022E3D504|nr:uncharacterized protein LOC128207479 isoform X1 [Mya arenaria]XP_052766382.1 uncharacterized protein LOC128207479 isoform X1 [Mya arenaria]XP_052766384.1 uncharacterized protein LOC128207479 isoform X1 [Mya arenaria]